jgi:hypothetical protein
MGPVTTATLIAAAPASRRAVRVYMAGEVGDDGQRLVFRGVDHAADRHRRQLVLDASMRTETEHVANEFLARHQRVAVRQLDVLARHYTARPTTAALGLH